MAVPAFIADKMGGKGKGAAKGKAGAGKPAPFGGKKAPPKGKAKAKK